MTARTSTRSATGSRGALVGACLAAGVIARWFAMQATPTAVDAELVTLLVGMALIKGALVVAAIVAVGWRFGWPVDAPRAWAYGLGLATTTAATVLIAHLAWIGAAAIAFHAGALVVLVTAWRDDGLLRRVDQAVTRRVPASAPPSPRRPTTSPSTLPGIVTHAG